MIRSGDLRHRVTLQENTGTDGGSAACYEETEAWTQYMQVWANIDTGGSRAFWAAQQRHQDLTHLITMPWREDLDPTKELRIQWTDAAGRTHYLYPQGPPVNVKQLNRFYEWPCIEDPTEMT